MLLVDCFSWFWEVSGVSCLPEHTTVRVGGSFTGVIRGSSGFLFIS